MLKNQNIYQNKSKGFTFFELIIIISIISIISLVAVPNFQKVLDKTKIVSAQTNLTVFQQCIEQYYLDTGTYPANSMVASELSSFFSENNLISTEPINPYTKKPYQSNDTSGKIVYSYNSENSYSLSLYDKTGSKIIQNLSNI